MFQSEKVLPNHPMNEFFLFHSSGPVICLRSRIMHGAHHQSYYELMDRPKPSTVRPFQKALLLCCALCVVISSPSLGAASIWRTELESHLHRTLCALTVNRTLHYQPAPRICSPVPTVLVERISSIRRSIQSSGSSWGTPVNASKDRLVRLK